MRASTLFFFSGDILAKLSMGEEKGFVYLQKFNAYNRGTFLSVHLAAHDERGASEKSFSNNPHL